MAHSKVGICNMALAILGADAIRAFDEKNKRARMADVFFDITRDYLLSVFDWPFARSIIQLQEVDTPDIEVPDWATVYNYPSDCRSPRDILPSGSRTRWEVIGNYILVEPARSLESERHLKYTKSEVDTSMYSDTFVNLLALSLAVRMCMPITQDKVLAKELKDQLRIEQLNAWESDANMGNDYRAHDEDPNNDTFVNPEGWWEDDELRIK